MQLPFSQSYIDIQAACDNRILLLDGAFGTMVQRLHLAESDFRGEFFKNHPVDLKGNNDVLCLTAPDKVASIHTAYLDAGADNIDILLAPLRLDRPNIISRIMPMN